MKPRERWSASMMGLLLSWACCSIPVFSEEDLSQAQPREEKIWCFGVLFWHDSPNDEAAFQGIREALDETGKKHQFLVRRADSDSEAAQRILAGFEKEPVDLIFALGTRAALLAKDTISEIPVVFTAVTHPVESGVVPSWQGSGTNLAGNSNWIDSERVLYLFRMAVPGLERLGILRSESSGEVSAAELGSMRDYLKRSDAPQIKIVEEVVSDPKGIAPAVDRLHESGVQAIWIPIDYTIYENMDQVLDAVQVHGLPLVSSSLKGAQAGAVAGVVVDYGLLGKSAAVMAIEILDKGVEPGSLPIEIMKGYQVIVNLEAARRCRYELPLTLLALADAILEDPPPKGDEP
ncbi:MAG: ABC transporter substrate-binding protein [Planctomycetes bacterium]|nr:ABC transporter substrate-binding protein [Planctomycetota bacterium]